MSILNGCGLSLIAPCWVLIDDTTLMAVTVYLDDGHVEEFSCATLAERRDGRLYVLRYTPHLTLEWIATFAAKHVCFAHVHLHRDGPTRVMAGDRQPLG